MSRVPIDLESLSKQKAAKAELQKRPIFLTAAQREALRMAKASELGNVTNSTRKAYTPAAELNRVVMTAKKRDPVKPMDERKKRRKQDPRNFNFDWDGADDTSSIALPSYNAKHALDEGSTRAETDEANEHWSEKALSDMRERDWRIFKEDFNIQTKGGMLPPPLRKWIEADLPTEVLDTVLQAGYHEPTPIQRAAIPIALGGRDLIGIAETGSGKTASFLLPILAHIYKLPDLIATKDDGPLAIVLAPTRELVQQIEAEAKKFAAMLNYNVVSIVGGHAIEEQVINLHHGAHIVIATPGRLLDCLERHVLVLSQCYYVVMDEADRMVDLGFEEAVGAILDALPGGGIALEDKHLPDGSLQARQTIMFSATMAPAVDKLARKYLRRPATVLIGNAGQVVDTVEQRVEIVNGDNSKRRRMAAVLNSGEFDRPVIVFVNTKKSCDMIAKYLASIGWKAGMLHGGRSQEQRETSLAHLKDGSIDALVATDLAGRGIDVADVTLVLNYDMSKTIEDYVHRLGRTGRAGRNGVAITFIQDSEEEIFYPLKLALKAAKNVPAPIRSATKAMSFKAIE